MEITYTVGIKGSVLPFFTTYRVKTHQIETRISYRPKGSQETVTRDITPRLVLTLWDDSTVVIGGIEEKTWKVYPDFIDAIEAIKSAREAQTKWVEESAPKITGSVGSNQSPNLQEQPIFQQSQPTPTQLQ